jgi:hypothetical protein
MPKERMFTRIVALLALAAGLATISTASAEELVDTGLDFNVGPAAAVDDAPNSQDNDADPVTPLIPLGVFAGGLVLLIGRARRESADEEVSTGDSGPADSSGSAGEEIS